MFQFSTMHAAPAFDSIASLPIEPLPFDRTRDTWADYYAQTACDPFVQSVLQLLLTLDETRHEAVTGMSTAWPQLTTIEIPASNAVHLLADGVATPDDQRAVSSTLSLAMSPGQTSRKRLRVETLDEKRLEALGDDDVDDQLRKRFLSNSRRDAVALLREEARALETTLKGLHLRQSRPKSALISDDPDALVKSYAENIQLKRAIEEQDAKIKTLRRAVSMREGQAGTSTTGKMLLGLQLS